MTILRSAPLLPVLCLLATAACGPLPDAAELEADEAQPEADEARPALPAEARASAPGALGAPDEADDGDPVDLTGPTVAISGRVVDWETFLPVPGATVVEVADAAITAVADASGDFTINVPTTYRFSLSATAPGYQQGILGEIANLSQTPAPGALLLPMLKSSRYQQLVAGLPGARTDHGMVIERLLENRSVMCNRCSGVSGHPVDLAEAPWAPVAYLDGQLRTGGTSLNAYGLAVVYNAPVGRVTPRVHNLWSGCGTAQLLAAPGTGLVKTRPGAVSFPRHQLSGMVFYYSSSYCY